jgi:hypothetical protein
LNPLIELARRENVSCAAVMQHGLHITGESKQME